MYFIHLDYGTLFEQIPQYDEHVITSPSHV
jgi:hypothetical protein